jgi:hypothetical protein
MQHQRFSPSAGIAIAPILFMIAMLAVIAAFMASGGADFQTAGVADQITANITSQANLIRNTINNCNLQYSMALAMGSTSGGGDGYPTGGTTSSCPSNGVSYNKYDVTCLLCDPMGTAPLWGNDVGSGNTPGANGNSGILLPPAPPGFSDWMYINSGTTNGRCIWIAPTTSNPVGSQAIVTGLSHAASKFNFSGSASTTNEVIYSSTSASQKFVVWITPPSSANNADPNCVP